MADFQFSKWQLSATLNFQKLEILTSGPVQGHTVRHIPNFAKIRWTVSEIWPIFNFSKWRPSIRSGDIFPIFDFSRWRLPPSWILEISNFFSVATLKKVELRRRAKIVEIAQNAAEIWRFFNFSWWRPSAILDFQKLEISTSGPIRRTNMRHRTKFREDRSNRSGSIFPIFDFSRWRLPPSWILEISNF